MNTILPPARRSWLIATALAPIIALAPSAVPGHAQGGCTVQSTPYFTEYYGDVTVDGAPAASGAVVEAVNGQGVQAGCFVVTNPGIYGYIRVFGANAATGTPGMASSEAVTFKVDGAVATSVPASVLWSGENNGPHEVDLSAEALPPRVEDVRAEVDGNAAITLVWTDVSGGTDHYEIWHSASPYFAPQAPEGECIASNVPRPAQPGDPVPFPVIGDPATNDYYVVLAVTSSNVKSLASNRVGAFDFALTPGGS